MKGVDFENILELYPDLVEEGLTLEGRQYTIGLRRVTYFLEIDFAKNL